MKPTSLHHAHRFAGALLGAFLLAHLAYVGAALAGFAAQRPMLDALRTVYRFPPAEALLLACVLLQAASGLALLRRGWAACRGMRQRAQFLSGAYLAFFLLVHTSAVLVARGVFGIDTDFRFAAAGMQAFPQALFFVPYYLLALASLAIHAACAILNRPPARRTAACRPRSSAAPGPACGGSDP